ncbi:MAG: type II toxin-antitoxin system HicA family toxin [Trueperaceae bacterium]
MSRKEKLIERLRSQPKDFSWNDLVRLLRALGYEEVKRGKTGGSRRRFSHNTAAIISLHKPHPGNELKTYQVELVLKTLTQEGLV